MTGAELISAERQRQIDKEGFDIAVDANYRRAELVLAAASYLLNASKEPPPTWPWDSCWWKPGSGIKGRIRSLTKAGALIAAEIDRLQGEVDDAVRDLGDRLDKAEAELQALLNAKEWKDKLDACGAGRKSAFEECARLAEEMLDRERWYGTARQTVQALAAKFRQLAEGKGA